MIIYTITFRVTDTNVNIFMIKISILFLFFIIIYANLFYDVNVIHSSEEKIKVASC